MALQRTCCASACDPKPPVSHLHVIQAHVVVVSSTCRLMIWTTCPSPMRWTFCRSELRWQLPTAENLPEAGQSNAYTSGAIYGCRSHCCRADVGICHAMIHNHIQMAARCFHSIQPPWVARKSGHGWWLVVPDKENVANEHARSPLSATAAHKFFHDLSRVLQ